MPTTTLSNTILRKNKELSKLQSDKASEIKKAADLEKKIASAKSSISRTKSESIIKSKVRDIDRYSTQLNKVNQKIAGIEKKIAQKSTEISNEESKLRREESKALKKRYESEKNNYTKLKISSHLSLITTYFIKKHKLNWPNLKTYQRKSLFYL